MRAALPHREARPLRRRALTAERRGSRLRERAACAQRVVGMAASVEFASHTLCLPRRATHAGTGRNRVHPGITATCHVSSLDDICVSVSFGERSTRLLVRRAYMQKQPWPRRRLLRARIGRARAQSRPQTFFIPGATHPPRASTPLRDPPPQRARPKEAPDATRKPLRRRRGGVAHHSAHAPMPPYPARTHFPPRPARRHARPTPSLAALGRLVQEQDSPPQKNLRPGGGADPRASTRPERGVRVMHGGRGDHAFAVNSI